MKAEGERTPKNVFNRKVHDTRSVAKPRTRWADVVLRVALQIVGIGAWTK
jgi:hypothetical protein